MREKSWVAAKSAASRLISGLLLVLSTWCIMASEACALAVVVFGPICKGPIPVSV